MCDHTGMAADRASGWPLLVECDGEGAPDARQLKAARYYDVVNFARHVTVPTYVTAGIIDSLCPPTTVYAMYNQLKGEKHMLEHPTTRRGGGEVWPGTLLFVFLSGRFPSREAAVALVAGASAVGLGRIFGAAGSGPACPVRRMARIYVYGFVLAC